MKIRNNRNASNLCLLCNLRPSNKTKSHIIQKAVANKILLVDGKNEGYVFTTESKYSRKSPIQDSPKEDYILCTECEEYFSKLETYFSDKFYNKLWIPVSQSGFIPIENGQDQSLLCKEINSSIFQLYLCSIFWRISICDFFGKKEELNELRPILADYLIKCQGKDIQDIIEKTLLPQDNKNPLSFIICATKFPIGNNGIILFNNIQEIYYLFLGSFVINFSFNMYNFPSYLNAVLNYGSREGLRIKLIDEEFYFKLNMMMMTEKQLENLKHFADSYLKDVIPNTLQV